MHPFFGNGCFICDTMFDNKIIGKHVDEHSNNICDFFAYGNEKSMKTYCSMVQNYDILNHQFNETNFKTLKERNNLSDYIRGTFIQDYDGEDITFNGKANSLKSRLKLNIDYVILEFVS